MVKLSYIVNPKVICLSLLCKNPNAIHLLEQHLDKLDMYEWKLLSFNCATRLGLEFEEYQDLLNECNVI